MRNHNHPVSAGLAVLGILVAAEAFFALPFVHAQSPTPGADRTQGSNYNSNQPPGMYPPQQGNGGYSQNGASNPGYNGFNPMTGTWSNTGTGSSTSQTYLSTTNGFNPQAGVWTGSASSATGGMWSTTSSSGGGSMNIFTPSQAVSGASNSSSVFGQNTGPHKLNNGPKVIPHVYVRPEPYLYNRVPIRPRF